jgi:acetylglutamate kinase
VISGTTAGVLDDTGQTVPLLDPAAMESMIASGTATAGMIAKLRACEHALLHGVGDVVIVDGRDEAALLAAATANEPARATRLVAAVRT